VPILEKIILFFLFELILPLIKHLKNIYKFISKIEFNIRKYFPHIDEDFTVILFYLACLGTSTTSMKVIA